MSMDNAAMWEQAARDRNIRKGFAVKWETGIESCPVRYGAYMGMVREGTAKVLSYNGQHHIDIDRLSECEDEVEGNPFTADRIAIYGA